jgi:hypothetical protein
MEAFKNRHGNYTSNWACVAFIYGTVAENPNGL